MENNDFKKWLAKEHPNLDPSNKNSYKSIQRFKKAFEAGQQAQLRKHNILSR
jgi:hypothetical protein